jgi:hypothetical protein
VGDFADFQAASEAPISESYPLLRPPSAKNRVNGCHNELGSTVRNQFQAVNSMKRQHQLSQLGVIS